MNLILPSFEIINQSSFDLEGAYKQIELIGRVSHKSEDRITEDSYKTFVENIKKWGHTACLEQGTLYFTIPDTENISLFNNPYTAIVQKDNAYYITTNCRTISEINDDISKYITNPSDNHIKRICVKFTCSRAISHELVRHRVFSFLQESQRYVNYKNKRGINFIQPLWYNPLRFNHYYKSFTKDQWTKEDIFYNNCCESEYDYFSLLDKGLKPQEAREVLINATKTEICMTGFTTQWEEFFKLRCDNAAHPEMRRLTIPLKEEFIKRGYINNF